MKTVSRFSTNSIKLFQKTPRSYRRHIHTIACSQNRDANVTAMRRLILMRHAESEETKSVRDHDRQLTETGRSAARSVGQQLRQLGWLPDILISSNALRSRQTLEELLFVIPELEDADQHLFGSLYTTSQLDGQTRGKLQEIVIAEATEHSCVLCLGHNKGWEEAASSFAGEFVKLGNCHAALLQATSTSNWTDAFREETEWKLVDVITPE